MSKWLNQFLENEIVNRSDRFRIEANMSPLSVRPQGLFDENLEKVENNPRKGGDKSDRFKFESNISPLSVRPPGLFDENLGEVSEKYTDNTDRFKIKSNMSVLSVRPQGPSERIFSPYGEHDFEERLAIAEYDGDQTAPHANRIAYLDAFISVLTTLPATDLQRDWLDMRIQTTLAWIETQEYRTIN